MRSHRMRRTLNRIKTSISHRRNRGGFVVDDESRQRILDEMRKNGMVAYKVHPGYLVTPSDEKGLVDLFIDDEYIGTFDPFREEEA